LTRLRYCWCKAVFIWLLGGWRLWADSVCCYNIEGSNTVDSEFLPCSST
jgi:hypothetical protein